MNGIYKVVFCQIDQGSENGREKRHRLGGILAKYGKK